MEEDGAEVSAEDVVEVLAEATDEDSDGG